MKFQKSKFIAVLMTVVIFISIFLIGDNNNFGNRTELNHYPLIENIMDEELINTSDNLQLYKWNKNLSFYLDIDFILFCVLVNYDIYKLIQIFKRQILKFYFFSSFVVFFINRKDGKKRKCVYS